MQCEDALNLLSARLDDELDAADRVRLDAHLAQCADCRAAAEAMQLQDAQLVRAFVPRRKAAAQIADRVAIHVAGAVPRRSWWLPLFASAAAGFLLALVLMRVWMKPQTRIVIQPSVVPSPTTSVAVASGEAVGRLDFATGAVEVQPAADTVWQPMPTGGVVRAGCRVRTAHGVRCEFAMDDGSQVRVNQNSEIAIKAPRQIELASGQVWSSVARQETPFAVTMADTTVTALGTRFDVQRQPGQIVLAVMQGSTRISGGNIDQTVPEGKVVRIAGGQFSELTAERQVERATAWIDEIVVKMDPDSPRVRERVNDLLAHLGEMKGTMMGDDQLRALGDRCVLPLTRYLQSDRSQNAEWRRRGLAKVIADVAQPWCIPYLIELLDDRDGYVRFHAAAALHRLTDQNMGRAPEQWRDASPYDCRQTTAAWKQWWDQNKHRYPGVPPATAPVGASEPTASPVAT